MKLIIALAAVAGFLLVFNSVDARASKIGCSKIDSCYDEIGKMPRSLLKYYSGNLAYNGKYKKKYQTKKRRLTRFPRRIARTGYKLFIFSPYLKRWAAYDATGRLVGRGVANGGADYCADVGRGCRTPRGLFRVRSKGTAGCKSGKFPLPRGGAPMPYCMFFHGGYAIHGSPGISNTNGSHGCIRVKTAAARWLHQDFINHGTRVLVLPY